MATFIYFPNLPNGPDRPADDQPGMQVNTGSISGLISVDHIGFNNNNGGLHQQVSLLNQASPALLGDCTIYSRLQGAFSVPWVKNAFFDIPLIATSFIAANNGITSLAGGIIIQWGRVNSTVSSPFQQVTFAPAFINNCFTVFTQPYSGATIPSSQATVDIRLSSVSTTGFQWAFVTNSSQYTGFFWVAIGN